MLADPKASAMAENFAGQWLEVRNLDSIKPDPQKFPAWGPELRDAMKTETRMFFDCDPPREPSDRRVHRRALHVPQRVAGEATTASTASPGRSSGASSSRPTERGGVLSHGSVLAVSSYPTRTSVVIRGKYILQNILGTPPPPPPPDVPPLDEQAVGTTASLRKQMEKHRTNAICASCHSRMDPLGFALENYDAIGKWRTHGRRLPGGFERRAAERQDVLDARRDAADPQPACCPSSRAR